MPTSTDLPATIMSKHWCTAATGIAICKAAGPDIRVCRASAREMGCKERAASTASPAGTKTAASSMRTPVSAGCASQLLKGATTAVVDGRRAERLEAARRRWRWLAGLDGRGGAAGGRWRAEPAVPEWASMASIFAHWSGRPGTQDVADVDEIFWYFVGKRGTSASPDTLVPMVPFAHSGSL